MRWAFQKALFQRMTADQRIILLWCDVGGGLWKDHQRDFPSRVINCGVMEQATVSMAAGMAMEGLRPIVYTITPFLIERAFEQIKIDVDQQNLPVGLAGHSNDQSGPTHEAVSAKGMIGLLGGIYSYWPTSQADVAAIVPEINLNHPWFLGLTGP